MTIILRIARSSRNGKPLPFAAGIANGEAVAAGYVVRRFHRDWHPKTEPDDPAPPPDSHSLPIA